MKKYLTDILHQVRYDEDNKVFWYSDNSNNTDMLINDNDCRLLITCITNIIFNDFEKIKKLSKYLMNVAKLFNTIELPITWNLPHGLTITQSYMQTITSYITPFIYSKTKLNFKRSYKHMYDKAKQSRALMPNLIHSLDATTMSLLYKIFTKRYFNPQFFSIHDCFGTTCDKVYVLKALLASVYTDLYSNDHYLIKFDMDLFEIIKKSTDYKVDYNNRTIELPNGNYIIHEIDWVLNKKTVNKNSIKKIDAQNLLI